ncbi:unnamed protein product [Periconia digitata]|uniref:Uncharacterized protein n=1 Tax=Periconia digitata TaxID=1303443 RepID=A0A9W4XUX3_9PLEO|nr:unnamed protein product [Periconia digitata]
MPSRQTGPGSKAEDQARPGRGGWGPTWAHTHASTTFCQLRPGLIYLSWLSIRIAPVCCWTRFPWVLLETVSCCLLPHLLYLSIQLYISSQTPHPPDQTDRRTNHSLIANHQSKPTTNSPNPAPAHSRQTLTMCLVKVRKEEEVDVVPYRRVVRRDPSPRRHSHQSVRRISRTEVIREHESPRPSASYIAVPAPKPLPIPAPQPAPVFYEQPAPPPPPSVSHHHHQDRAHYVEVTPHSPRSSYSSHSPSRASDYVVHEREYRRQQRRDYSPEERSPRYEHFRYVEGPENERYERRRSRSRVRSVSRGPPSSADYGERVTRERVSVHVGEGRRSRDYRGDYYR